DYKGSAIYCGYRLDLIVEEEILVELKAVERLDSPNPRGSGRHVPQARRPSGRPLGELQRPTSQVRLATPICYPPQIISRSPDLPAESKENETNAQEAAAAGSED